MLDRPKKETLVTITPKEFMTLFLNFIKQSQKQVEFICGIFSGNKIIFKPIPCFSVINKTFSESKNIIISSIYINDSIIINIEEEMNWMLSFTYDLETNDFCSIKVKALYSELQAPNINKDLSRDFLFEQLLVIMQKAEVIEIKGEENNE